MSLPPGPLMIPNMHKRARERTSISWTRGGEDKKIPTSRVEFSLFVYNVLDSFFFAFSPVPHPLPPIWLFRSSTHSRPWHDDHHDDWWPSRIHNGNPGQKDFLHGTRIFLPGDIPFFNLLTHWLLWKIFLAIRLSFPFQIHQTSASVCNLISFPFIQYQHGDGARKAHTSIMNSLN